ncbi:cyanophycinase [Actinomadura sp. DC4]|uniref:cyanophycinase n=1 Tax=Actinomadura sp. DC4 TaxID=3055069 RepID=UPI0025B1BEC6|nr:cyanophycinase [Actinomadura sp. DC4]MDN3356268.1 cyanophycinase [Actinomadura sp. DC4]
MKRLAMLSAATVLAATMTTPAHATTTTPAPGRRGAVILIGGALSDGNAEIYHEIVARAGGARARIGVITAASLPPSRDPAAGTPQAANSAVNGRFYADILKRYGAGAAQWLPIDLDHPGAADDPALARQAATMTGFVFGGGDQYRLVTTFLHGTAHTDTKVLAAIRDRHAHGALIAGTSAGAQIQSGPDMVTGGASYQALREGTHTGYLDDDTLLADLPAGGFGLFTDGLIDTHFSADGRLGRAVRLASDTGHRRVFGLDPDTALEATGTTLRVLGRHGVSVVDLRAASTGVRDGRWSITGVRWSYLTDGAVYDPASWSHRMPPGATRLTPADRAAASPVQDVFDSAAADRKGFRLTRAALDLAGAGRSAVLHGLTYETDPVFTVALGKDGTFTAWGDDTATSFADLTVAMYAAAEQP